MKCRSRPVKLYSYFRSSAAYRVRIALNLKRLTFDTVGIHLQKEGGQNLKPDSRASHPQGRGRPLRLARGAPPPHPLAIIKYPDKPPPAPPLIPAERIERARVRAAAQLIACDIHPLNN